MGKRKQGYEESLKAIDKISKMTDEEINSVAKNILRTVSLDRKQIEDRYIITRKEFADAVMKTIMNPDYKPTKNQKEEDRADIVLKYINYVKQESMLDYNRRLLQMINK